MIAWIIVLFVLGMLLICAEMFVPGGILGAIGALCLLGAIVVTFVAPDLAGGGIGLRCMIAAGIVASGVASLFIWMRVFDQVVPKGLRHGETIAGDSFEDKKNDALIGQTGVATTDLRPIGKARIDGKSMEVRARSGMLDEGTKVEVVSTNDRTILVIKRG